MKPKRPAKQVILALSAILAAVIAVAGGFRYSHLNRLYPSPQIVRAAVGETLTVNNEIRVSAENLRVYEPDELYDAFDIPEHEIEFWHESRLRVRYLAVDMEITNDALESGWILPKYWFHLRTGNWESSSSPFSDAVNPEYQQPGIGETARYTMIFIMAYERGTKKMWDNIENEDFELSSIYYPYTYRWQL